MIEILMITGESKVVGIQKASKASRRDQIRITEVALVVTLSKTTLRSIALINVSIFCFIIDQIEEIIKFWTKFFH